MFLSDFNAPRNGKFVDEFCNLGGLTSLIKKKDVSKILTNPHASNQIFFSTVMFSKLDFPTFTYLLSLSLKWAFRNCHRI